MTILFNTNMDFYNDPNTFLMQKEYTTSDDELFMQMWQYQLQNAIQNYNTKQTSESDKITFLRGLVFSAINKYRVQHHLVPFVLSGVPNAVAQWHSEQRLSQSGSNLVSVLQGRPHRSANLGGISGKTVETDLFLQQTLGMTELIGHVTEYTPQDELLPDFVNSNEPWTLDEINNPLNWPQYATDIVATIAGTWSGKSFLMQTLDETLYLGLNAVIQDDHELVLDVITASKKPTVL